MVPKIHKKGKSFRGAAQYVLHDKEADTNERVEWTATVNIASDDPEVAWRVMAATSMDQARLKQEAGVSNAGRKSKDHVLHVTLSWHAEEAENLSREEMMRAAYGALNTLGARDRQALITAHNDTPEPHIHILVNRVSQEDGTILSSSKEKLNLSRWAQSYEEERGEVLCPQRVVNNAARNRGEYTRGEPNRPRHLHELESANDNTPDADRIKAEQQAKDAEVARERREKEQRRAETWKAFEDWHRRTVEQINEQQQRDSWSAQEEVRGAYRPRWESLHQWHADQLAEFEENEERFLGRMRNASRLTDWKGIMEPGLFRQKLGKAFGAFSSSGARLEALKRAQEAEEKALHAQQLQAEQQRQADIARATELALAEQRAMFEAERSTLILTDDMEAAAGRAQWAQRRGDREIAYGRVRSRDEHVAPADRFRAEMRERDASRDQGLDDDEAF